MRTTRRIFLAVGAIAILAPVGVAHGQRDRPVDCVRDLEKSAETVASYWSFLLFKVGAFDLGGALSELRPEAEVASTPDDCADVLERFMAGLRDGHANLIYYPGRTFRSAPSGVVLQRFSERMVRPGARRARARLHVVEVDTALPDLAGVVRGSEVVEIDGVAASTVLAHVEARTSASTNWGREHWSDRSALRGPAGTPVEVKLRLPDGEERTVVLPRPAIAADEKERRRERQAFEDTVTVVEWKRLPDDFGYIRLTTFSWAPKRIEREFDRALDELRDTRGLVLDMRDNGGGYVDVLQKVVGRFFDRRTVIARMLIRVPGRQYIDPSPEPMSAPRRRWTYDKPLVLLVNAGCFSACDLFANAMDENDRALIIGPTPTGGGSASPIGSAVVPEWDGVAIRVSFFVAHRNDGSHIEGRGIRPHRVVQPTLQDYIDGRDVVLEHAIEALRSGEGRPLAAR